MSLHFLVLCKLSFFVIVFLFARLSEAQCFSEDPLDESAITLIACGIVTDPPSVSRYRTNDKDTEMFQFNLTCKSTPQRCDQIGRALERAGDIITNTLSLKAPILVNVTFLNFCEELNICSTGNEVILGRAAPAQYIPMEDDDGETRYYPQALVKQLFHARHRTYMEHDIAAKFNDVPNFWVEGGGPIGDDQNDFTLIALHELVHGLGLATSWRNSIVDRGLTTNVTFEALDGKQIWRFKEYAFDRYMIVIPEQTRLTSYKNKLNAFSESTGAQYTSLEDWKYAFVASPQEEISEKLHQYAETPNSLGFQTNGTTTGIVILETSLTPFMPGSSLTHIDYKTYTGTSDFLMRFRANAGVTLDEAVMRGGNYSGGAIGPRLKAILETLGYPTPRNPNPYEPKPDASITLLENDASTGALSKSKFSTGLLLAMIVVVLLVDINLFE